MNRNRQLPNVYWRNAKPYLNWQSTQPSVNSTSKWMSIKSNTGNFMFQREPGWMQRPVAFEFVWGDELWPSFPLSHATSKWPSLKQVSVKRGLRSANSRLSVKRLQSSFCILHAACVLLIVCSLHFIPGPQSAFYTHHLSNFPRMQLDTHEPSVLNIYMEKPEIPVEKNKMVRVNPFEKLHKKGCVN